MRAVQRADGVRHAPPFLPHLKPRGRALRLLLTHILILLACTACSRPDGGQAADSASRDSAARAAGGGAPRLASDATLAVLARGEWIPALRAAADAFAEREGVLVVLDTTGSTVATTGDSAYLAAAARADLVLDADHRIARLVARDDATWRLRFAGDRVVLAWRDSLPRGVTLQAGAWWDGVLRSRVRVGRVDPRGSELGRRTLLVMQLAERASGERRLAARLAQRTTARDLYPSADSLGAALAAGDIALAWTYESTARHAGWQWLPLGDDLDLGDPTRDSTYALASVTLPAAAVAERTGRDSTGRDSAGRAGPIGAAAPAESITVRGAPMAYALTIPRQARNPSFAERLVRFLFSGDGRPLVARAPLVLRDSLQLTGIDLPAALRALPGVSVVADSVPPPRSPSRP